MFGSLFFYYCLIRERDHCSRKARGLFSSCILLLSVTLWTFLLPHHFEEGCKENLNTWLIVFLYSGALFIFGQAFVGMRFGTIREKAFYDYARATKMPLYHKHTLSEFGEHSILRRVSYPHRDSRLEVLDYTHEKFKWPNDLSVTELEPCSRSLQYFDTMFKFAFTYDLIMVTSGFCLYAVAETCESKGKLVDHRAIFILMVILLVVDGVWIFCYETKKKIDSMKDKENNSPKLETT